LTEDGADLPGYELTAADQKLDEVYGDHVHDNDATHLDGGIPDDPQMQQWYLEVTGCPLSEYTLPKGGVGRRFLAIFVQLWYDVIDRKCNSEKPFLFQAVVMQRAPTVKGFSAVRKRLTQRMNMWEAGDISSLVDDTLGLFRGQIRDSRSKVDLEAATRACDAKLRSGRLREAVNNYTRDCAQGGVLQPNDIDAKTNCPVIDVLKDKHPRLRDPDIASSAFEDYSKTPTPVPLQISADDVETVSRKMSGSAGPSGADAATLKHWLLRFGNVSTALRTVLAKLAEWMANDSPSAAAIRALLMCRLVALDKQPGVRPLGIGEIIRRLIAKCVIHVTGYEATEGCGNSNLCVGLPSGIEGAVHAVLKRQDVVVETVVDEELSVDSGLVTQVGSVASSQESMMSDDSGPATQTSSVAGASGALAAESLPDEDAEGLLLIDARNGFNELSRKCMLWTVRHRWAKGSRFVFNCYRHASLLIVRDEASPGNPIVIQSSEGLTQGDPLAMIGYGLTLAPLTELVRVEVPEVLSPFFADDGGLAGSFSKVGQAYSIVKAHGPDRGYYPEDEKSVCVCRASLQAEARAALQDFPFTYVEGHRYLGSFAGSTATRDTWLDPKIQQWVASVEKFAQLALRFPQSAYAGLTKSLQMQWQYTQRVVPDCSAKFAPVEKALRESFLPALFQIETIDDDFRRRLALSVKQGGLGIPNPVATADGNHEDSLRSTRMLTESLLEDPANFDVRKFKQECSQQRRKAAAARQEAGDSEFDSLIVGCSLAERRRINRTKSTGRWLTVTPADANGTTLSANEFRDSLMLRYGLRPHNLPERCDGCNAPFTVNHAMCCPKGGLIAIRHDEMKMEWHSICAAAFKPSRVTDEPEIHSGRGPTLVHTANGMSAALPETRGDVGVHGFFERSVTTIFDVSICDTDCPSYRNMDPAQVLVNREKNKKTKHLAACLAQRRTFTPLVFSVDGLRAKETNAACKHVAAKLATKWKRSYSDVCGYVHSRLSIALVRSASLCLRGARDPLARCTHPSLEDGAGLSAYQAS
jgi:hypothetical protein